ncbi:MAG: hypothetical protein ACXABY_02270 [Candidatus Thorarchaeota archaeon]|jgi:hypothetical protein
MSKQNLTKANFLVPVQIIKSPQQEYKAVASNKLPALDAQPDLLYMRSVLVSTGSNKNDDVFLPDEMWKARSSPILKFINWEHNSGREATEEELTQNPSQVVVGNQIIGVMYNSFATDENGVIIDEEKTQAADFEIPESFHIVDEGVIYKGAFPKVAARVENGAQNKALFVSMEAWFDGYDYLVGNKVVARNEETAFLESKLRANGGDGSFGHDSVRRVLRNIVFGGKGIVERPANEPSVIQSVTHEPITANAIKDKTIAANIIGSVGDLGKMEESIKMSEQAKKTMDAVASGPSFDDYKVVTQELAETRVELKTTGSELETTKSELDSAKADQEALRGALTKGFALLEKALPGIGEKLAKASPETMFDIIADGVKAASDESQTKVDEATKAKTEAETTLAELQATVRAGDRLSKIQSELSLGAAEGDDEDSIKAKTAQIQTIAEQTKTLDDEAFVAHLEGLKSLLVVAKKGFVPFGKKKDEDKDEKKDKKKDAKADDESADEGITDASILDAVKATASAMPAGEENNNSGIDLNVAYGGLVDSLLASRKTENQKDN